MKLNEEFRLRTIAGQHLLIYEGTTKVNFNTAFALNQTSSFLWNTFKGKEFQESEMVDAILENYEVSREMAETDVHVFVENALEKGIINQ